eukprot:113648-Chlamydomonas_euryale.AAC.2
MPSTAKAQAATPIPARSSPPSLPTTEQRHETTISPARMQPTRSSPPLPALPIRVARATVATRCWSDLQLLVGQHAVALAVVLCDKSAWTLLTVDC